MQLLSVAVRVLSHLCACDGAMLQIRHAAVLSKGEKQWYSTDAEITKENVKDAPKMSLGERQILFS